MFVIDRKKRFVFLFTRQFEQYVICHGSGQQRLWGYNQHNNQPDHDHRRRIPGPRGPREAQSCAPMRLIDWGQLPEQADLLLGGVDRADGLQSAPLFWQ